MSLQSLWEDFRLFMKNLFNVKCNIIVDGDTFKITIDDYIIHSFTANSLNDFKFELNRFKLIIAAGM